MTAWTIGRVSAETGCGIETIRYYERVGLLAPPPRSGGGHRLYSPDHVKRLVFIRRGRELGFSLDEIRGLLALAEQDATDCRQVWEITLTHAEDIRRKILDLTRMESVLRRMAADCADGKSPDCPIIESLFEPAEPLFRRE